MARYRGAQRRMPSWIAIAGTRLGKLQVARHQAPPCGVRKGRYVWDSSTEVKFETTRKERAYQSDRNVDPFLFGTEWALGRFGLGGRHRAPLLHERASPDARYQQALACEAVVSEGHGRASYLQPSRQLTRWR